MITLSTIEKATWNPFLRHSQLQSIWPEPYLSAAYQATWQDVLSGQILYIKLFDEVIGITGIFFDDSPTDVYLRWTGIVPQHRRSGYAAEALEQLCAMCKNWCPERTRLIELVPYNEYGRTVALPFFVDFGFEVCTVDIPVAENTDWPVVPYAFQLR